MTTNKHEKFKGLSTLEEVMAHREEIRSAAKWCAQHGYEGKKGDPLPNLMCGDCVDEISNNIQWFKELVKQAKQAFGDDK